MRRPRAVLVAWCTLIAALSVVGLGVATQLHNTSIGVPGTPAARATRVTDQQFGQSQDLIVLLLGPAQAVAHQEPRLTRRLLAVPGVALVTPTSRQSGVHRTILLLRIAGSFQTVTRQKVNRLRAILRTAVARPVHAYMSGFADVGTALYADTISAIHRSQDIVVAVLLIVLLLVFGTPLAAAIPLLVGLGTIGAGAGALVLVNHLTPLDAVSLNMETMMGLALGVDYSLLFVSRFRSETRAGATPAEAVATAMRTAGHTVITAGVCLLAVMLTAALVLPGALLSSSVIGVTLALVLSVPAALLPVPAALVLFGDRLERWPIPIRGLDGAGSRIAGARLQRRPALAAAAILTIVGVVCVPAFGLQTGPPDIHELPPGSIQRTDFVTIQHALGRAWTTPYLVTLTVPRGQVTDPSRLAAITRWERQVAHLPGVSAVFGPGALAPAAATVAAIPGRLHAATVALGQGTRQARQLGTTFNRDTSGLGSLVSGLHTAASGAGALHAGDAQALGGAQQLSGGLGAAGSGAGQLSGGLETALGGAEQLGSGSGRLASGADRLAAGLGRARAALAPGPAQLATLSSALRAGGTGLAQLEQPVDTAQGALSGALAGLQGMLPTSKLDPAYRRVLTELETAQAALTGQASGGVSPPLPAGYAGLDAALATGAAGADQAANAVTAAQDKLRRLNSGLGALGTDADQLTADLVRLHRGVASLTDGLSRLGAGGRRLAAGLATLTGGGRELTSGLTQLDAGSRTLAGGLAGGIHTATPLAASAQQLPGSVGGESARLAALAHDSAGSALLGRVARGGLLLLAAVDAASPAQRMAAGFVVNLSRGGTAAVITVIGRGLQTQSGSPLRAALERAAGRLAAATGGSAYVGGPAATLQDFDSSTSSRFPLLIGALALVTMLVLALLLGSLVLAALAVALNLLTVGAGLGVLVLVFQGSHPLGGGPGWLDAVSSIGVFAVMFALSIDYEVFLLARMREAYRETKTLEDAIQAGLVSTAPVVIGAAAVMAAVFIVFAATDMSNIRELGVGLSAAIVIDSTVVRLILLPACLRLIGDRCFAPRTRRSEVVVPAVSSPAVP